MPDFADQLIAELTGAPWPLPREVEIRQKVMRRRALRKGDREMLAHMAGWDDPQRAYLVDPLASLIERTYSDFLFGEEPRYTLPTDSEQEQLDEMVEATRFSTGVRRASRVCIGEGEVWWSLHVNEAIAEVPLTTWRSRLDAVPLFYGERLLAVAFVSVVREELQSDADENSYKIVWRHAEVHAEGEVVNVLFRGSGDEMGEVQPLDQIDETNGLTDRWEHGLPILAGRVVNDLDEDPALGISDLDQIEDLLLALNEALTIATENARLTGKDRVFAAGEILLPDGSLDTGIEVIRVESEGAELGGTDGKPPIVAIEKRYDAAPLWLHIAKLTATTLSRAGIVQQLIGEEMGGNSAESGVARRLRFLPTENAAQGKGTEWDAALPHILHLIFAVGSLPVGTEEHPGGFGWSPITDLPTVERADPLPRDDAELIDENVTAFAGGIRSRRSAVQMSRPDLSEEQIDQEVAAIEEDEAAALPQLPAPSEH